MKKILITTGGSGGHVIPALNLYDHLKKDYEVEIYTDVRGAKYFPKEIKKTIFEVQQIPEKKYFLIIKIIFLFFSFIKSLIHFKGKKFDIVISTGGYMSFPIVLAAKFYNKKIFLFEPNSIIGRSNKFLLKFSHKIFCYDKNLLGVKYKYKNKIIKINPILKKCFYEKKNINLINKNNLRILIIGGSQSSKFFTNKLKNEIIKLSSNFKIELTQQLSQGFDIDNYRQGYDKNKITNKLFFFEKDFLCKNKSFDIAITRSGASTLSELVHLNIPFIAIPFPYSTDNHQFHNAKRYKDLNCCWILEEKNFNSDDIYKMIYKVITNENDYLDKKIVLRNLMKIHLGKI